MRPTSRVLVSLGLFGATLFALAFALDVQGQPKTAKARAKAEIPSTPPADAEFTRFGIYESTAPVRRLRRPLSLSCR